MLPIVTITANELRALAESADSRRGKESRIVRIVGTPRTLVVVGATDTTTKSGKPVEDVEIRLHTVQKKTPKSEGQQREGEAKGKKLRVILPKVKFKDKNGKVIPGPRDDNYVDMFDALFWDESSVEKFLVPYYVRYADLEVVARTVRDEFMTPGVVAIGHLPDSEEVDGEAFSATSNTDWQLPGLYSLSPDPNGDGLIAAKVTIALSAR